MMRRAMLVGLGLALPNMAAGATICGRETAPTTSSEINWCCNEATEVCCYTLWHKNSMLAKWCTDGDGFI